MEHIKQLIELNKEIKALDFINIIEDNCNCDILDLDNDFEENLNYECVNFEYNDTMINIDFTVVKRDVNPADSIIKATNITELEY